MEQLGRLFTEQERLKARDELLEARSEIDAQIEALDARSATVEEWEVRYTSAADRNGRVDYRLPYRVDAIAQAHRGNEGACFGEWIVTPRHIGEVATAGEVS